MPFVRKKIMRGKDNYQYVESFRLDGSPRQKIIEHLGSVVPTKEVLQELKYKYSEKKIQQMIRGDLKFKEYRITQDDIKHAEKLKDIFHKNLKKLSKKGKEELISRFKTGYTYHSCSIEGNTLNLAQVSQVINKKESIAGKKLIEIQEVRNHKEAIDYMMSEDSDISEDFIKRLHSVLAKDIKDLLEEEDPTYIEGDYRIDQRYIAGADFIPMPSSEVPDAMKGLIAFYKKNKYKIHPLELASEFHLRFVIIHPFSDGNGRMARLLSNYILDRSNFPMIDISVENREDYIASLAAGASKNPENSRDLSIFSIKQLERYLKSLNFG